MFDLTGHKRKLISETIVEGIEKKFSEEDLGGLTEEQKEAMFVVVYGILIGNI